MLRGIYIASLEPSLLWRPLQRAIRSVPRAHPPQRRDLCLDSLHLRQARSIATKKQPEEESNEDRDLSRTEFNDDPYPQDFNPTHTLKRFQREWEHIRSGARIEHETVRLAGRIRAKRTASKKLVFYDIAGDGTTVQVLATKNYFEAGSDSGKGSFQEINASLRRGDIIGVEGIPGKSGKGELSVVPTKLKLLSPCKRNLPQRENLYDPNLRFRKRHLDLITNASVREVFVQRSRVISSIRRWLEDRDFIEVETPILYTSSGGALATPFVTHMNAVNADVKLRIAPELFLKKLVVGGFDRVFEIGKVFRNEGLSAFHNPEFTSCEFYKTYTSLSELISMTEQLLAEVVMRSSGSSSIHVNLQDFCGEQNLLSKSSLDQTFGPLSSRSLEVGDTATIDFKGPYDIVSVPEMLESRLRRRLPIHDSDELGAMLLQTLHENHIPLPSPCTNARMYDKLIGHFIEPQCIQPTFLTDHPLALSPLAKERKDKKGLASRFELFVGGKELVNAYEELNDPDEQMSRFYAQSEDRRLTGDTETHDMDNDFVEALRCGLPPTAGWGLGIDRLCMLLSGSSSIREVLFFPILREMSDAPPSPENPPP
eukprot:gb/GECG01000210.1/.p1 GENE.gb/GECG01000210.1/~~gb/GECG01000210.1/.p1  ORF type:complete len:597 (+),score=62.77 gb/GECG01000210.1/:1-1791(+)